MKPIPLLLLAALALSACNPNCTEAVYEDVKAAVAEELKSPSTASFPPLSKIKATGNQTKTLCTPTFTGYVDAQNKFGAIVRLDYVASAIRKTPDQPAKVYILKLEER
ncbi:MAG: hypothetical protein ABJM82_18825 [Shimia thalassica]|uniref:hypothetical protein n=1 Tax=Shimia thalassica TaxID=1715693 RepID=UPI0032988724